MDIVKLILAILIAVGFITCIVCRCIKKHKEAAYVIEIVSLVLLIVIAILPIANGITWKAEPIANLFILIGVIALFIYRIFFRTR